MRGMQARARPAWAVALMCAVAFGGCKKNESTEAAGAQDAGQASATPAPAAKDAGTVAVADTRTPFAFKDVTISRTTDNKVKLTYTLENHGAKRARGYSCLTLHDKDGYELANVTLGPISLKGGESDGFEDIQSVDTTVWDEARTVLLYAGTKWSCYASDSGDTLVSEMRHLDLTGKPVPAGTAAPRQPPAAEDGVAVFELTELGLSQESPSSPVVVTFNVKNKSASRMNASVCLRLYDSAEATGGIDEAASDNFSLAQGATKTVSSELTLDDDKSWNSTVLLRAYASTYGCASSARTAVSNVVELRKPAEIHTPVDDAAVPEGIEGGEGYEPEDPVDEPERAADGVSDGQ
ncbi:hypothetical protein JY651_20645 [Pyxidicoccus parkwayensis]|uniref:Lipoprotein n=1 Tax=Pyxidicoccus parkwayensis TaxID=2813578 RepID=A0ABX7P9Q4_9BACT|nr:hypothetical protein [Pyxidicoccus parkwaysis]QSQ27171.1 hypothetical protein JY651_20645 [Pyxidicoccus parkwaysis]